MRRSGILMHISSLPGPGGIGSLGKEAYAFADFLKASGMAVWPHGLWGEPLPVLQRVCGKPHADFLRRPA